MYPLFETVCIRDAKVMYPEWHIRRYEESFLRFYGYPPQEPLFDSVSLLDSLQRLPASDMVKMKILYGSKEKTVELSPYSSKNIQTLKMVEADDIDYSLKFADRSCLDELTARRGIYDDILIIKDEMVTDSSFCNIVFFDGDRYITPSTPLLRGVARQRLLDLGVIEEREVRAVDIGKFGSFVLINAMRDFFSLPQIPVGNIF